MTSTVTERNPNARATSWHRCGSNRTRCPAARPERAQGDVDDDAGRRAPQFFGASPPATSRSCTSPSARTRAHPVLAGSHLGRLRHQRPAHAQEPQATDLPPLRGRAAHRGRSDHLRHRRAIQPLFHNKRIAGYIADMTAAADLTSGSWSESTAHRCGPRHVGS